MPKHDWIPERTVLKEFYPRSKWSLRRDVRRGLVPKPVRIGDSVYWHRCQWESWTKNLLGDQLEAASVDD